MPGGAAAIREPWRMAVSWALAAVGPDEATRIAAGLDPRWHNVLALATVAGSGGGAVLTTSAGRLFDAVAALLGVRLHTSYEGQAAIELEMMARRVPQSQAPRYPVEVLGAGSGAALEVLDPGPLVATVLAEIERGTEPPVVAAGFHEGLGRATAELAARLARRRGLDTVALSGGVFQNVRLSNIVEDALLAEGLEVLVHESIPPNDGGISIGQAAIAALGTRPPVAAASGPGARSPATP